MGRTNDVEAHGRYGVSYFDLQRGWAEAHKALEGFLSAFEKKMNAPATPACATCGAETEWPVLQCALCVPAFVQTELAG